MTLSDLSVRRPVFAAVAAIILCVVGLASFTQMTVRELPAVDPPVISISTDYRGASSEVIEERITEVIERQVAGIEGVDRMTSGSRDGSSRINIQFKLSRDLDAAANDVRDAVSRVSANLPLQADPPQIRKADADAQPIIFLGLSSTTLNRLQLTDYANRYLVERVSTVPGVAQVGVGGAQNYAMRIWLDPQAMASRDITVTDVENALNAQNLELPAGALVAAAKDFTIRVARGYSTAEEFANLPVVTPGDGGYVTRLGDIARVSEEADERRRMFRSNGRDLVGIAVTRQSQANDLEIFGRHPRPAARTEPGPARGHRAQCRCRLHPIHPARPGRGLDHHGHLPGDRRAGELHLPGHLAGGHHSDRGRAHLHPVDLHRPGAPGLLSQPADPAGPGAGHRPGGR